MATALVPPDAAPVAEPPAAAQPRPGLEPSADRPFAVAEAIRIVAWLSIVAGTIHAVGMIDHFDHFWLFGVFFLVLTYGQVLWGVALLRGRFSARFLTIGAFANLAIVAVWLLSRTIGVPLGPEAGSAEPIGSADVAATLDELLLAAYVAAIVRPDLRAVRGFRALLGRHRVRLGMAVCSASFFAALIGGHSH